LSAIPAPRLLLMLFRWKSVQTFFQRARIHCGSADSHGDSSLKTCSHNRSIAC
jgi:hypothetical protein